MDDLIKRADVLNVMKKASFGGTITEAVEAIPAVHDVNRWIPVDERFPTETESKECYILCFCRASIICLLEWNGEY